MLLITADCFRSSFVHFVQDLSSAVLRAAMSGLLLLVPSPTGSMIPPASTPNNSAVTGFDIAANAIPTSLGHGHAHSPQWDEAFLGLLSVAVWKLPSVRRALLTCGSIFVSSSHGVHSADASFRQETRAGETDTVAAVAAVFCRMYHPYPSVRRLASSIAIRLAFDPPSIFSPMISLPSPWLHRVSIPCRGGDRIYGESFGKDGSAVEGLQFRAVEERAGGDIECFACLALGGLNVPPLVLKAYPRVVAWAVSCSCRGDGDEAENDLALALTAPGCIIPSGGKGNVDDGRRERLLCLDLAADQWGLLCRRRERFQGFEEHHVEVGVARRVSEVGEALEGASRRSEFSSALAVARAWMLAEDM